MFKRVTSGRVASLRCPTCRKIVLAKEPEFPFCSERCRTIDLGKWASGAYVISTPVDEAESLGDLEDSNMRDPGRFRQRGNRGQQDRGEE
jgi:endogenous inhibitor of DNA gyrase (YacG/DUF329 family)